VVSVVCDLLLVICHVLSVITSSRRAVTEVLEKAKIVLEGPLRASIEVSLKISDTSYIKQVITLDAYSPYLSFTTEVGHSVGRYRALTLNLIGRLQNLKKLNQKTIIILKHCEFLM